MSLTRSRISLQHATGGCPLHNEFTLKFRQGGEDAEHQLAARRRRVDRSAMACQHAETDLLGIEVVDEVNQVPQVASETIQLPDQQGVSGLKRLETGDQAGPGVTLTGSE
ncbi:DNA-binding LytR/AlgR family response regulator [Skermanella aerolata]